jgi:hypothetical protein
MKKCGVNIIFAFFGVKELNWSECFEVGCGRRVNMMFIFEFTLKLKN